MKHFDYIVRFCPNVYKVAIAIHARDMFAKYRQLRLKALGESDDRPYNHHREFKTVVHQMYHLDKEDK